MYPGTQEPANDTCNPRQASCSSLTHAAECRARSEFQATFRLALIAGVQMQDNEGAKKSMTASIPGVGYPFKLYPHNPPRYNTGRCCAPLLTAEDPRMTRHFFITCCLLLAGPAALAGGAYQTADEFLNVTFANSPPDAAVIWLTGERKKAVEQILGHRYPTLRVRYWESGQRSAWILEEIGKEQPITVGIVVNEQRIEHIEVLVFRESRGWEIRHSFFTDQFKSARLNDQRQLDRHIDGISGATLSVRAMEKLARLALYLDSATRAQDVTPAP
jgi:hypothetical protein